MARLLPDPSTGLVAATSGVAHPQPKRPGPEIVLAGFQQDVPPVDRLESFVSCADRILPNGTVQQGSGTIAKFNHG